MKSIFGQSRAALLYQQVVASIITGPPPTVDPVWRTLRWILASVGSVTVTSVMIGLLLAQGHLTRPHTPGYPLDSLELLYLLAVIWLALTYGKRASILASILAFLAYDFFFIPPVHQFTVDDPTEYASLGVLLVTGLIVAVLTSAVRTREHIAQRDLEMTAALYAFSQAVAAQRDETDIARIIVDNTLTLFGPIGFLGCAVLVPDDAGQLRPLAIGQRSASVLPVDRRSPRLSYAAVPPLDLPEQLALAEHAYTDRTIHTRAAAMTSGSGPDAHHPPSAFRFLRATQELTDSPRWYALPLTLGMELVPTLSTRASMSPPAIAQPTTSKSGVVGVLLCYGIAATWQFDAIGSTTTPASIRQNDPQQSDSLAADGVLPRRHLTSAIDSNSEGEAHYLPTFSGQLLAACCGQAAIAIDRARLAQTAVHVAALRESDRLKTALLDSVTHDLRTPIAAITTAATSLQQPDISWNSADRAVLLNAITTSATRLKRMVNDLLLLSRIESGGLAAPKQPYPISDVIAAAVEEAQSTRILAEHQVAIDQDDDLLMALLDPAAMQRVLVNLIENAAKYSPPGSPITITVRRDPADHVLEVTVRDHGIGIPENDHQRIFERFTRLHQPLPWSLDKPPLGSGLGLSICAGLVREHGGDIRATNPPDGGAAISFWLPLAPEEAPAGIATGFDGREDPQRDRS